jgi:hypothetical protein
MPAKETTFRSWSISSWPPEVFPNDPLRARRIVRLNRDELLRAGAVSRVGRELVIFGDNYLRWLASRANKVTDPTLPLMDNVRKASAAYKAQREAAKANSAS